MRKKEPERGDSAVCRGSERERERETEREGEREGGRERQEACHCY